MARCWRPCGSGPHRAAPCGCGSHRRGANRSGHRPSPGLVRAGRGSAADGRRQHHGSRGRLAPRAHRRDGAADHLRRRVRADHRPARGERRGAECPVEVLVLTDVPLPLPLPIDITLRAGDLTPSPTELMLAAGGIAFGNPTDAAIAYPDLWPSREAAKKAFSRTQLGTNPNRKYLYGNVPNCVTWTYQKAGQRQRRVTALVDPVMLPDPAAAITLAIGPLAWCRPADAELADDAQPPAAPGKPAAPPAAADGHAQSSQPLDSDDESPQPDQARSPRVGGCAGDMGGKAPLPSANLAAAPSMPWWWRWLARRPGLGHARSMVRNRGPPNRPRRRPLARAATRLCSSTDETKPHALFVCIRLVMSVAPDHDRFGPKRQQKGQIYPCAVSPGQAVAAINHGTAGDQALQSNNGLQAIAFVAMSPPTLQ
jgi:hypothetical protein